jgi:hypothetical protein
MKTKWGSCNHRARHIRLNTELVKKPKDLLEYVVVHEMLHLIEPTHSERFVALLRRALSDLARGALVVYLVLLIGRNLLDPSRTWTFSMHELRVQILGTAQVFGALFAAVYAGLYARFSSQWSYLANVYNQIKAAESRGGCDASRLAEWKAGFIEDAQDLHLALKPLFASVIRAWGSEAEVKGSFETYAPGGALRLAKLMSRVELAWERAGKDWVEKG